MKVKTITIDREHKKIAFNDIPLENVPVENYMIHGDHSSKELRITLFVPHLEIKEGLIESEKR